MSCSRNRATVHPLPVPAAGRPNAGEEEILRAKQLMVPVENVAPDKVPDTFSASRGDHEHNALDILAPRGTPVLAADDGSILRLSTNPSGGITIYQLDDDGRFVYYYAHLDHYRAGLKEGIHVVQGDVIGYVGTTGNAPPNIPHLHFQLMRFRDDGRYWDGTPIDPHFYLVRPGRAR